MLNKMDSAQARSTRVPSRCCTSSWTCWETIHSRWSLQEHSHWERGTDSGRADNFSPTEPGGFFPGVPLEVPGLTSEALYGQKVGKERTQTDKLTGQNTESHVDHYLPKVKRKKTQAAGQ